MDTTTTTEQRIAVLETQVTELLSVLSPLMPYLTGEKDPKELLPASIRPLFA